MKIFALKPGHDGTIAALEGSKLLYSLESEKNSFPRFDRITPTLLMEAASHLDGLPDVVAISGWVKGWHSVEASTEAGYFGSDANGIITGKKRFFGRDVDFFTSTHERSHLLCAYGMSPFPQGKPCYVLVWEGNLGDFYLIDENVKVTHIARVLTDPGNKYSYLFFLGDPSFPNIKGHFRFGDAGKMMALGAFSDRGPVDKDEGKLIDYLLARDGIVHDVPKSEMTWSKFHNIGVESKEFKNLAGKYSDAIFDRFYQFARQNLKEGYPLLIAGGCGLNCEWNSKWHNSGLFEDVFVPPCTNDTGSAIGTAVDAQHYYTGNAKIEWNVYAGLPFVEDCQVNPDQFEIHPLDLRQVAGFIEKGNIIGWNQGKYEIGPRALGNRSILASPLSSQIMERLNDIKQREAYRPIAPLVLEEDAAELFEGRTPSPHMLYFQTLKTDRLQAVTHVDNSARIQTVAKADNPDMHAMLSAFKQLTGFGVLCNTSLNFKGKGFINQTSDMVRYCLEHGLDGFVIHDKFYIRKR